MKKSILTISFLLCVNVIFAQNAYQNVLDTIEVNSTVLSAHHKKMEADKSTNDAYALFENPELEAGYKFGPEGSNKVEVGVSQEIAFPTYQD